VLTDAVRRLVPLLAGSATGPPRLLSAAGRNAAAQGICFALEVRHAAMI
jgi:hypothetical protein